MNVERKRKIQNGIFVAVQGPLGFWPVLFFKRLSFLLSSQNNSNSKACNLSILFIKYVYSQTAVLSNNVLLISAELNFNRCFQCLEKRSTPWKFYTQRNFPKPNIFLSILEQDHKKHALSWQFLLNFFCKVPRFVYAYQTESVLYVHAPLVLILQAAWKKRKINIKILLA